MSKMPRKHDMVYRPRKRTELLKIQGGATKDYSDADMRTTELILLCQIERL